MSTPTLVSTTLAAVAFDTPRHCLRVQFRDGSCYEYGGVPYALFQALLTAESKGAFFNRMLRGKFPYIRLTAPLLI